MGFISTLLLHPLKSSLSAASVAAHEGVSLSLATGMCLFAVVTVVMHFFMSAPYGKLSQQKSPTGSGAGDPKAAVTRSQAKENSKFQKLWGPKLPASLSWFAFELPNLLIPFMMFFFLRPAGCGWLGHQWGSGWLGYVFSFVVPRVQINANLILLGLFVLHYVHRAIIFPMAMPRKSKPLPILVALAALCFTTYNAFMQTHYLCYLSPNTVTTNHLINNKDEPIQAARSMLGVVLFIVGAAINIRSDYHLLSLKRHSKDGSYQIPSAGLFQKVSAANYFGEAVEWFGFAIAVNSMAAWSFAFFVALYLGGRALHHHAWYKAHFNDYPLQRKAFIPFVL